MGVGKRLGALTLILIFAVLFALPGCSVSTTRPAMANLALCALVPSSPSEAEDIASFLKDALDDFKVIDALITDSELGLLEDETSTDEEMTMEELEYYLGLLGTYSSSIKNTLGEIKARPTPNHQDIGKFRTAEISQFELADDLISEYMQLLNYYQSLLSMSKEIEKLENVDSTDLETIYKSFSEGIGKAIDKLKGSNVPTFLKSMNDNTIASLTEFDSAVLYMLQAEYLDDPVRRDAATYRMGILQRKFERITEDSNQDMDDRTGKLKDDLKNIQRLNDGLKQWALGNIDKLSDQ